MPLLPPHARFTPAIDRSAAFLLGLFAVWLLASVWLVPFPGGFDELQHYSMVRAQAEDPALFPDYARQKVVDAADLSQWSGAGNYINHPAPYYMALGLLWQPGEAGIVVLRVTNAAMSFAAMLLLVAGMRRMGYAGWLAALVMMSFPKAWGVGAAITNDTLATLAAAAVFYGLTALRWRWVAAGLLVAGWAKLTAFIALGLVVGFYGILTWHQHSPRARVTVVLAALAGAIPYLVQWWRSGQLLWVNTAHWTVPVENRPHWNITEFAAYFFEKLARKWQAAEGLLPLGWLPLLVLLAAMLYSAVARPRPKLLLAYLMAIPVFVAIHFYYAWASFVAMGDQTMAQMRYYQPLWPGMALMLLAAAGTSRVRRGLLVVYLLATGVVGAVGWSVI